MNNTIYINQINNKVNYKNNDTNIDNINFKNTSNIAAYNQVPLNNLILESKNCCLIKKEYIPDINNIWGGNYAYNFNKLTNDECNPLLYDINSNTQLLFDGENNWNNNFCNNQNNNLGSCRFNIHECVDFVSEDFCNNINITNNTNFTWSPNTCEEPLKYIFNDNIKYNINTNNYTNLNSFSLF